MRINDTHTPESKPVAKADRLLAYREQKAVEQVAIDRDAEKAREKAAEVDYGHYDENLQGFIPAKKHAFSGL